MFSDKGKEVVVVFAMVACLLAGGLVLCDADSADATVSDTDVAKIGDVGYSTLDGAVSAASERDIVVLLEDVTLSAQLEISKAITLDGGGHTLTSNVTGRNAGILVSSSNVTIKDLKVSGPNATASGWDGGEYGIKVWGENLTGVVLDGVTVTSANSGILVNGGVTLKGVTTVSGNEFGGIEVSKSGTDKLCAGTLTFDEGASVVCADADVPAIWVDLYSADYSSTIGNAFPSGLPDSASAFVCETSGKDQLWVVTGFEARIGNTCYATFEAVVSAATSGQTVTLLKDVQIETTVVVNKELEIDGDGKTVSAADNFTPASNKKSAVIYGGSSADLTLKDVKIDANSKGRTVVVSAGKLTIETGTMITGALSQNYVGGVYMTGKATFTMTGGEISGNRVSDEYSSTYLKYSSDLWIGSEVNAVISGGVIGNLYVNANEYSTPSATTTVSGGSITNAFLDFYKGSVAVFHKTGGSVSELLVAQDDSVSGTHTYIQQIDSPADGDYSGGSAVAVIGSTYYAALASAVEAAKSEQTVTLLKDVTLSAQLEINKAITLDGGSHVLKSEVTGKNAGILVSAGGVTIKDLTVSGPNATDPGWDSGEYGIKVWGQTLLTGVVLDHVTVTGANSGILVNGEVTLNGVITVSGNEFGGIEVSKSSAGCLGKVIFAKGASVVCTSTAVPAMWVDNYSVDYGSDISEAVSNLPASVQKFVCDGKDQLWFVTGFDARVGNTCYATLEAAVVAATSGQTVTLLKDVTLSAQLEVSKAITLDGGGHTLTSTLTSTESATSAGILVSTSNVTIKNLTVHGPNARATGWDEGEYGIKIWGYNLTGVVLDGVTVTSANSGILVNGEVTLKGVTTVSGNEFGGIEVSKASNGCLGKVTFADGASLVCSDASVPAMWVDMYERDYSSTIENAFPSGLPDSVSAFVCEASGKDQLWVVTGFEARIGNTCYATLQDAINAVSNGKTITVLRDITVTSSVSVPGGDASKSFTINFDGHNLIASGMTDSSVLRLGSVGSPYSGTVYIIECKFCGDASGNSGVVTASAVISGNLIFNSCEFSYYLGLTRVIEVTGTESACYLAATNCSFDGALRALDVIVKFSGSGTPSASVFNTVTDPEEGEQLCVFFFEDGSVGVMIAVPEASITTSVSGGSMTAYFVTVNDAVVASTSGQTVVLLKDVTLSAQLEIDKAITLDGGGHTLTSNVTGRNAGILVSAGGVTIKDLTVSGPNATDPGWDSGEYGIKVWGQTLLTGVVLDHVTVTGANSGILVNGEVTLNGVITVSGNEFGGIEVSKSSAGCLGKVTFADGASLVCTSTAVPAMWVDGYSADYSKTSGNAFTNLPSSMSAFVCETPGKDQLWVVTGFDARVGNTCYVTLEAAVAAATSGQTVTFLRDVSGNVTIDEDDNITLNLNGHNLTSASGYTITDRGALTITGSGNVSSTSDSSSALFVGTASGASNTVSLTVSGGTYTTASGAPNLIIGSGSFSVTKASDVEITVNTDMYGWASAVGGVNTLKKVPVITVDYYSYSKTYGDASFNLNATRTGDGKLWYRSNNTNCVSVDTSGSVGVVGAGTATVYVIVDESDSYLEGAKEVTVAVSPKSVAATSVTWAGSGFIYSGQDQGSSVTASFEVVTGEKVSLSVAFLGTSGAAEGQDVFRNAGGYTATATNSNGNYSLASTTRDYTISKAELTPSVDFKDIESRYYDGTAAISGTGAISLSGAVNGESPVATAAGYALTSKDAGTKTVKATGIALSGSWGDNYSLKSTEVTSEAASDLVTPLPVASTSVAWTGSGFTYSGQDQGSSVTASFEVISDEEVSLSVAFLGTSGAAKDKTVFENAGGYTATASTDNGNYSLAETTNVYSISKRAGTLTSANDEKQYDGTPLTNHNVTVSEGLFVGDEGVDHYDFTGAQTNVGSSDNTFTYTLKSNTIDGNYNITRVYGTLEVIASTKTITITAASDSKIYDGIALTNNHYTYTEGIIATGDVLTAVVEGTITDVGSTHNVVKSYKVMQGEVDVTKYYTFGNSEDGTLEVTPKQLTISSPIIDPTSRIYDGSNVVNVTPGELIGVVEDDTVNVSASASMADANAGINKPVTIVYTIDGADKDNYYKPVDGSATFSISKATPNAGYFDYTAPGSLVYDKAAKEATVTLKSGYEYVGKITVKYNGSEVAPTGAGTYVVSVATSGSTNFYATITDVTVGTFVVEKAHVTVTAKDKSITYGDVAANDGVTYSGLLEGDSLSGTLTYSYTYSTTDPSKRAVGTYDIVPGGLTSSNYAITFVNGALTVGKLTVALRWTDPANLVYSGTAKVPSVSVTNTVYSEVVTVTAAVTSGMSNVNVGTFTFTASALSSPNYALPSDPVSGEIEITMAPLTVTANPKTITYGDAAANAGVTYSGFVNRETKDVLGGTLGFDYTYDPEVGSKRTVNTYDITPKGLTSGNYEITFVKGTLTVVQKEVALTWNAPEDLVYTGKGKAPTVTVTGTVYDESVDAVIDVTIEHTNVHVGTFTFTASALTNTNYKLPVDATSPVYTITKKDLTITAKNWSITYGSPAANDGYTYDGFVTGEGVSVLTGTMTYSYTYSTTDPTNRTIGYYDIVPGGVTAADYEITFVKGTLTVVQKEVGLQWTAPADLAYSGTAKTPSVKATGLAYDSDVVNVTAAITSGTSNVNVGRFTFTATALSNPNYKLPDSPVSREYEITAKAMTVTVDVEKTYDGAQFEYTISGSDVSGLVFGDSLTAGKLKTTGSGVKDYTVKTTDWTVSEALATANGIGNYSVTFSVSLEITQREVTLTWSALSAADLVYSGTAKNVTATAGNVVEGETVNVTVSLTSGTSNVNVGTFTFTASDLNSGNYRMPADVVSPEYTITKAPLTVTANAKTITYGGAADNAGVTYSGFVGTDREDTPGVLTGSVTYAYTYSTTDPSKRAVGTYDIIPGGQSAANYDINFVNGKLTVDVLTVELDWGTLSTADLVYSGTAKVPSVSVSNAVYSDIVTVTAAVTTGKSNVNVGTFTFTASALDNPNYDLPSSPVSGSYAITKAPLTITANAKTITYGGAADNAGVTYSGFVNGETESVLGGELEFSYTYDEREPTKRSIGSYFITPAGLTSTNYNITFYSGTLTVVQLEAKLSWTDPSNLVYSGTAKVPTVAVGNLAYTSDVVVVTASLTAGKDNVNAGSFTFTATALNNDNYVLRASVGSPTYIIARALLTVTADSKEITYGDSATYTADIVGFVNEETVADLGGSLSFVCDYNMIDADKRKVGTYDITPTGLTSNNYAIAFVKNTLKVDAKVASLQWTAPADLVYSGTAKVPVVTVVNLAYVDDVFNIVSGVTDPKTMSNINAGKFTFTVVSLGNSNYDLPEYTISPVYTISKADSRVVQAPEVPENLVYTGGSQRLVIAGVAEGGDIQYCTDTTEYSKAIPEGTDAGTYHVHYKVVGDPNHNDSVAVTMSVAISKAESVVTKDPVALSGLIYTGKSITLIEAGTASGGTINYRTDSTNYDESLPAGVAAGTYNVYYKVVGDSNHNDTEPLFMNVTISKANPVVTVAPAPVSGLVYTGDPIALISAGTVSGGTFWYSTDSTVFSTEIPTGIAAGTYLIYYKVVGDGNHNDTATARTVNDAVIAKADSTVVSAPVVRSDLVYSGYSQVLLDTSNARCTGGTLEYSMYKDAGFSTNVPTYIDYTDGVSVYYKVVGDSNHNDTSVVELTVKIAKATYDMSGVTWSNSDLTYDGTLKTVVIATGLPSGVYVIRYADNSFVSAGEYVASVSMWSYNSNYNVPQLPAPHSWTIGKATYDMSGTAWRTNPTYDGTVQVMTITGGLPDGVSADAYEGNIEKNAGSYVASVTKWTYNPNYYEPSIEAHAWSILKADSTITVVPGQTKVYDGTVLPIQTTGQIGEGAVTFSYRTVKDTAPIDQPVNAGDYMVSATVAETPNYYSYTSGFVAFSITRATYDVSKIVWLDETQEQFTYDGTSKTTYISSGLPDGVSVVAYINNQKIYAGSYLANVFEWDYDKVNYNTPVINNHLWTIGKTDYDMSKVTWADDPVYTGEQLTMTITGGLPAGVSPAVYSGNTGVYVGSYLAEVVNWSYDTVNYFEPSLKQHAWNIVKADYDMSTITWTANPTYNGSEQGVTISGGLPDGVTPTGYSGNTGVNAGEYQATVTGWSYDMDNYNEPAYGSYTWTIYKAVPTYTAPEPLVLTYTGSSQVLVKAGSADGGTMVYSLEKEGTYSVDLPTSTDASYNCSVYYYVIGDSNHTDTVPEYVISVIMPVKEDYETDYIEVTEEVAEGGVGITGLIKSAADHMLPATVDIGDTDSVSFNYDAVSAFGSNTVTLTYVKYIGDDVPENVKKVLSGAVASIDVSTGGVTFTGGVATIVFDAEKIMPYGKVAKLYWISGSSAELVDSSFNGTELTAKLAHFSTYALVFENQPEPEKHDDGGSFETYALVAAVIAIVAVCIFAFVRNRRSGV